MKKICSIELVFRKAAVITNIKVCWRVFKIFTIYCIIYCSLLLLFLAVVRNFFFWPCVVVRNSLRSEKGKLPFEQDMQYQAVLSSFSILYVWIFILLHFMCTHSRHLSYWIVLWFFVTGLLQILQGYFIGIFKSSYNCSSFDVLFLLQLIIVKFTFCLARCLLLSKVI